MFNLRLSKDIRPIGLDIGRRYVKMIQLQIAAGRICVVAAGRQVVEPTADDDPAARETAVSEAVGKILARGSFKGRQVISHIDNEAVKITSLRLAESSGPALTRALADEVSERFGLDGEVDIINYLMAGTVRQQDELKNELIVLAASDESIRSHIEMLDALQLRPVSIDAVPSSIFRSFTRSLRRAADRERTAIFLDVGARFTTVVFGRAGEINFIKQIRTGVDDFNAEIAERLDIEPSEAETLRAKLRKERAGEAVKVDRDDAEAIIEESSKLDPATRQAIVDSVSTVADKLAQEISLCLRYYTVTFRGKRVEHAYVSGGGAYESILLNVLKRKLAVDVDPACPLRGFDVSAKTVQAELGGDRRAALSEWAVATGLSLKGSPDRFAGTPEPEVEAETRSVETQTVEIS